MGEFLSEHLESVMMVAFIVATALGMYKAYVLFEKQVGEGIDINTLENEIIAIVYEILSTQNLTLDELYAAIRSHKTFDADRHKNFNQNRFNQILGRLYTRHKVDNFEALKQRLQSK